MLRNILAAFLLIFLILPASAAQTVKAPVQYVKTSPLQVALEPSKYLNKQIEITGKFDKFTTLGLDYKKAMRNSADYIGFLVQRDDVVDHNVPLSELKFFLKRSLAEKFIDLNTGDKIKIKGTVFSTALGDGWVDVESIQLIEKAPDSKK